MVDLSFSEMVWDERREPENVPLSCSQEIKMIAFIDPYSYKNDS